MRYHVDKPGKDGYHGVVKLAPKRQCRDVGCPRDHRTVFTDDELLRFALEVKKDYLAELRQLVDPDDDPNRYEGRNR
jgi:Fe-S cluster assembly iron-binding protein IscA